MLTKRVKDNIIAQFKIHKSDTGSAPVQIALLTKEIEMLTKHLRIHKKDFSSRRGLIAKVSQRRRLLKFLRQEDIKQFEKIIKKLKLRRPAKITAIEEDIKQEEEENLIEPAQPAAALEITEKDS
jgi:small subunit ribosomal protein S15